MPEPPTMSLTVLGRTTFSGQAGQRPRMSTADRLLASIHRFAGGAERFALQGVVNELRVLR